MQDVNMSQNVANKQVDSNIREPLGRDNGYYLNIIVRTAPFTGYLVSLLYQLGMASHYRIPGSFVSVGIRGALIGGCVMIVFALAFTAIYKYFRNYSPWKWNLLSLPWFIFSTDGYGDKVPLIVERNKNITFKTSEKWEKLCFAIASLVVLLCFSGIVVLFCYTLLWALTRQPAIGGEYGASESLFIPLYFLCISILIIGLKFLEKRGIIRQRVPKGFGLLKNWHYTAGALIVLLIGGCCFSAGLWTAGQQRPYLVSSDGRTVILKYYSEDEVVAAVCKPENGDHIKSGDTVRIVSYDVATLPELQKNIEVSGKGGSTGDGQDPFLQWTKLTVTAEPAKCESSG